jgi:hypothetical protein
MLTLKKKVWKRLGKVALGRFREGLYWLGKVRLGKFRGIAKVQ